MNELDFFLFDVDHGQCAALQLPNGRWCLFDLGASARFNPLRDWIQPRLGPYSILKTTISHLHGDHLASLPWLPKVGSQYLRFPVIDGEYVNDATATCGGRQARELLRDSIEFAGGFGGVIIPDYGGVRISEMSLNAVGARRLGGAANTRVNNASVVTRIDYAGRSILIPGDLETNAWEHLLGPFDIDPGWLSFVTGIDVLIAPHHGHTSGYSYGLLRAARPSVVLASVQSRDPHVDQAYSNSEMVAGIPVGGHSRKLLTTRNDGHIRIRIGPPLLGKGRGTITLASRKILPPLTRLEEHTSTASFSEILAAVLRSRR